jgi:hypothetical protein
MRGIEWISVTQDRDKWRASVNAENEPSGSIKCWEVLQWLYNF